MNSRTLQAQEMSPSPIQLTRESLLKFEWDKLPKAVEQEHTHEVITLSYSLSKQHYAKWEIRIAPMLSGTTRAELLQH